MNTPKRLYIGQPDTSPETIFTAPVGTKEIALQFVMHNTQTVPERIEVYIVPFGEDIGEEYRIFGRSVLSEDTLSWFVRGVLEDRDSIQVFQENEGAITLWVSAVEVD